ncbi:MAG: AAC(3) family N-acetyltransferase [Candidatus Nitrosopumilus sp. bin_32a]
MKKNYDFSKSDIIEALKKTEIKVGDSIFVHSNIGFFGRLENANNSKEYCEIFKDAIFEVIGEKGTLIVPTFSLSYCNNQIFDKKTTKSFECGVFSEFIRELKNSKRSDDANFSVAAVGGKSDYFTKNVSEYSFGIDSFWDRLWKENGKICRFNMSPDYNTFIHFVERELNVEYRYDKGFSGTSIIDNKKIKNTYYHYVHDLENLNHLPNLIKLDMKSKELGLSKSEDLGKGQIIVISTKDVYNVIHKEIKNDVNFLIKDNT